VRTTVSEIGPVLMPLLQLNDTQEGRAQHRFKIADEQGLLLLDFKTCRPCCNGRETPAR